MLALLVGFGSATAVGEAGLAAAVSAATEQIDSLRDRSPGPRTDANISKGKPRALARTFPADRDARSSIAAPIPGALPGPIAAPAVAAPTVLAGPVAAPAEGPVGGVLLPGAVPAGGGVFAGGPGGIFGPIGGGIGGIGGGGGGGIVVLPPGEAGTTPGEPAPETPGPVVVTPPGPPAPVPEPSRWALLILGFGTIGVALRTRVRDQTCTNPALR